MSRPCKPTMGGPSVIGLWPPATSDARDSRHCAPTPLRAEARGWTAWTWRMTSERYQSWRERVISTARKPWLHSETDIIRGPVLGPRVRWNPVPGRNTHGPLAPRVEAPAESVGAIPGASTASLRATAQKPWPTLSRLSPDVTEKSPTARAARHTDGSSV